MRAAGVAAVAVDGRRQAMHQASLSLSPDAHANGKRDEGDHDESDERSSAHGAHHTRPALNLA